MIKFLSSTMSGLHSCNASDAILPPDLLSLISDLPALSLQYYKVYANDLAKPMIAAIVVSCIYFGRTVSHYYQKLRML